MTEILVSFILVHYRTPELTSSCLRSIIDHTDMAHEIIVVDNSPKEMGVDKRAADEAGALVLESEENIGFGRGCNLGASRAQGRFLFFLNTDARLLGDTGRKLARFLEETPQAYAVGCTLVEPDGQVQASAFRFPSLLRILAGREVAGAFLMKRFSSLAKALSLVYQPEELLAPQCVQWCIGAALMIRRNAFESVGGFDPKIFMYGEEMDLCLRLAKNGGQTWYTPEAKVLHLEAGSSKDTHDNRRLSYIAAGHRYFYRKHHGRITGAIYVTCELMAGLGKTIIWSILALCGPKDRWRKVRWHRRYLANYFKLSY